METTRTKWDESMIARCLYQYPIERYRPTGSGIGEKIRTLSVSKPAEPEKKEENIAEELPDFPAIFENNIPDEWDDFKVAVHIAAF